MKQATYMVILTLLVALIAVSCSEPQPEQPVPPDSRTGSGNPGGSIPATSTASTSGAAGDTGRSTGVAAGGPAGSSPDAGSQVTQPVGTPPGRAPASPPPGGARASGPAGPGSRSPAGPPPDSATTTAAPQPQDPTQPPGYYLGSGHGLALAQTARQDIERREGWVNITLNLVAVRFDGGGVTLERGQQPNSICLEGSEGSPDCLMVKWGSEEQYDAELTGPGGSRSVLLDDARPVAPKAVNLGVAFQLPSNATTASLLFGEHKIPLDLDGDYAPREDHDSPVAVSTAPPSQDPKTGAFFMDSGHGIGVTGVSRTMADDGSLMSSVTVGLSVLSVGEYDPSAPGPGEAGGPGAVCFGKDGGECIQVFWGPEEQFDAALYLEGGDRFARARSADARWPLPVNIRFRLPHNHDSAVLKFGSHRIPIDLRGMRSDGPVYDYTVHYPEAVPGTALYEHDGKTVVLDRVKHDPSRGHLELAMTARNGNEASDFTPLFHPVALFSASGKVNRRADGEDFRVRWSAPTTIRGETLAPGQTSPLTFVVPRAGDRKWGDAAYSRDPAKRTDGAVFQVSEERTRAIGPEALPEPVPRFVRFKRAEDEREFFVGRTLWRHESESGLRFPAFSDVAVYSLSDEGILALDAETGERLWLFNPGSAVSKPIVGDGVVYVATAESNMHAVDAATGEQLWQFKPDGARLLPTSANGVVYLPTWGGGLYALKSATGERLWHFGPGAVFGRTMVADGMVYALSGCSHDGCTELYALDAASGEEVWRFKPPRYTIHLSAVAGNVVYVEGGYGFYALDAATGQEMWRRGIRSALLAVEGGMVYVRSSEAISALGATTGEPAWWLETRTRRNFRASVADGRVFAAEVLGGGGSKLDAVYDAATGELLWRVRPRDSFRFLTAADGVVYVMSDGLKALSADTGQLLWRSSDIGQIFHYSTVLDGVLYGTSGGHMHAIIAGGGR